MRVQLFLIGGFALLVSLLVLIFVRLRLRKVPPGQALVISGRQRRRVAFSRAIVLPLVERADFIDISLKTVVIEPEPAEVLISKDNQRLSYRASFYLKINATAHDVQQVAQALGCARASDPDALSQLFRPKLVSVMRQVAHGMSYKELEDHRDKLQDEVLMELGRDLNGFVLEDLVIDRLAPAEKSTAGPFR